MVFSLEANANLCLYVITSKITFLLDQFNTYLVFFPSADMKKKISDALLSMTDIPKWKEELEDVNVIGFASIDPSLYRLEKNILAAVKELTIQPTYY